MAGRPSRTPRASCARAAGEAQPPLQAPARSAATSTASSSCKSACSRASPPRPASSCAGEPLRRRRELQVGQLAAELLIDVLAHRRTAFAAGPRSRSTTTASGCSPRSFAASALARLSGRAVRLCAGRACAWRTRRAPPARACSRARACGSSALRAGGRATMPRDPAAGGREDLQVQLAEPGPDLTVGQRAGRDAVAVALESTSALRETTRPLASSAPNGELRQRQAATLRPPARRPCARRGGGDRTTATHQRSRSAWAWAGVDTGAERHHELATYPIAVSTTPLRCGRSRRADRDLHAVVLGQRRGLGRSRSVPGVHDRRHPVGPPRPRGAAEPAQHAVERLGQVREALTLAEHATQLPRVRQRADQHVRLLAPRRLRQLQPVQLQLLAGLVRDPDRRLTRPPCGSRTPAATPASQLPHQRRIGAIEPQAGQLPIKHVAEHVRVVGEPRHQIVAERLKTARRPLPRGRPPRQVLARSSCDPGRVCRAIAETDQPRRASA